MEDSEQKVPPAGTPDGATEGGTDAPTPAPDGAESSPPAVETTEAVRASTSSLASTAVAPEKGRVDRRWRKLPPLARTVLAVAGGAAFLGAALAALGTWSSFAPSRRATGSAVLPEVSGAPLAASAAGSGGAIEGTDAGGAEASVDAAVDAAPAPVSVWRVARLADDPGTALVDVVVGHRPLLQALAAARVRRSEAQRIIASLETVRSADRVGPKDTLTVASDKATGRVVAYELVTSPTDVWQGREQVDADGSVKLETRELKVLVERVRVGKALVVGADLRASLAEAGLAPVDDMLALLDDALDGHAELSNIRAGARLRLVATHEQVDGAFVRWLSLEAVEYFPATSSAPSVRVYSLGDVDDAREARARRGWYDAKGRQPYRGGWRTPVPLARIASRFNPHRMHPVLHVVMPHNGVDFAAPVGARVYATAAGVVTSVGFDGPCGNRVEIAHAGGYSSVYCHLSRFASGLKVGLHVEPRQLIAYVGQTGRVTGPHLHFGVRRGGTFIDPLTLRFDGVNVVPRAQRDDFDRRRAALDAELDDIPLPAAAAGSAPETTEPETIYEEP